jgi:hypothetical protein
MFTLSGFFEIPSAQVVNANEKEESEELARCIAQISQFPAFMGCVDSDPSLDAFANMRWLTAENRAPVVVEPVLPPELIYLSNHNDAVGELWRRVCSQSHGWQRSI